MALPQPSGVFLIFCKKKQLYHIEDSFAAGKFIGENGLAAVGNSRIYHADFLRGIMWGLMLTGIVGCIRLMFSSQPKA